MLKTKLLNKGKLSKRLLELEVFSFFHAIEFVKNLPYGRTADRANPNLVLEELKGTCSTKHAVLKQLAIEQNIANVKLYLCLFKMNSTNTPQLTELLKNHELKYIPEAHCILKIDDDFVDVTNAVSNYECIKHDVLDLVEIQPDQIGGFKVRYHQAYLKKWLSTKKKSYSFEDLWQIREQCINALS
jgi:hypothetical protein